MADRAQTDMRTLLVGLDAGCRSVLEPLFEAGATPHLRSLFDQGASGPLESQIPPWTPSAWPSLYTGVNPGKHGVFGFLTFDGYDWDVVNASHVREQTLWEILDYHGHSSVVVNAPVTHPPREIDGAIVPGYTAPEDPACHPRGLLAEIREKIGDYRVYAPREATGEREKTEWYRRLVRMRGEAFRYLSDRYDPDFGFVQFQQTDTVFHEFPGDDEKARAVYEAVDEQLGKILRRCDPDTVVVASDHGMGEYDGHEFRVNEHLRERGLVETKRGGEGMPTWSTIANNRLQDGETEAVETDPTPLQRGLATAAKFGLTSQRIYRALDAVGLADAVAERVPTDAIRAATEQVDFPASAAYMRDRIELGVRVNLEGREPAGVVPESQYEAVREEIIDALSGVETPDGRPVFERVARREEIFSGPYVDEAPDVVTIPADFDEFLSTRVGDGEFGPPSEPYNHKRDGIVAVTGRNVDDRSDLSGAHLFDVAPTVLATFGLPAGDRMDGVVLPAVEPVGRRAYPAFDGGAQVATDDGDVEARLADLGYLE
ncbi:MULTISPECIES: alkaline phosphatase family protein [Halorussus]|uniref:alkaline phosphatase family protein n=1 Tax=Halorussus TaxID=1070314 RepID=UPI0020A14C6F|nr:alkaline phosphatase family protein [Halorussus vallis]USZ76539.1 alkaline phosphatase family protein [Halorussus vallis]